LREQVQQATELAIFAIIQGLEGHASDRSENDFWEMASKLAGCTDFLEARLESGNDDEDLIWSDMVYAARALGIAQGLLLRPELFVKGGAE
jgi:hypothetical protein